MAYLDDESAEQLAPQILVALAEVITGGPAGGTPIGIYRSGPQIVRFFRRNGYEDSYGNWSRVSHTEEKLDEICRMDDGRECILRLAEDAVNPADYVGSEDRLEAAVEYLNRYLRLGGLELRWDGSQASALPGCWHHGSRHRSPARGRCP